jgi:polyferredoxin
MNMSEQSPATRPAPLQRKLGVKKYPVRLWLQIFFFALIGGIAINKTLAETGLGLSFLSTASLHALCPFGGVVTLYNLVTVGTYIQKIHTSSVILMVLVFILSILFGPVFCGWACPLGSIQEWIGKIGRKINKRRFNNLIPPRLHGVLRYFRFVVLIWVVYVTARSGSLLFATVDPYYALFNFWTGEVAPAALLILVATLVSSLFIARPWCKYACPYGALLGLFNKIRIFKIRRTAATCINCQRCDRVCPMNIQVATVDQVKDLQCISCYECTSERACPVPNTVNVQTGFKVAEVQKP